MSYIGRGTESISNVEVLDNLTFDGSASYTLQKSSTNFVPSSANNLLISISGVVQQGNFSVSGSTITFDTTVSASDTCDWILHYGTGLITTVADGAITEAKLGSNAVTTAKINNGAITSAKLDSGLALGKIGQVVSGVNSTFASTTSSTYSDTGLAQAITPSATNSKVLIIISASLGNTTSSKNNSARILRDATEIEEYSRVSFNTGGHSVVQNSFVFLDSPSTTSSTTYKLQYKTDGGTLRFNDSSISNPASTITLMEVLA